MEDEKVTISLKDYENLFISDLELNNLINTIFEFAKLNYDGDDLMLNESRISDWLKVNYKTAYNAKLELLKERKEKENDK